MKKVFKFILPIALVPVFASCGGNDNATHYVTFHQELAEDVKIEFNKNTTDGEIIAQEPELVKKEGYDAKWEDYTVVGKTADFTVNAIYSEYTYTVTFKQKGLIIDTVPFTASDVKGEHPQLPAEKVPVCPSDTWYTYAWEDYELKLGDVVVNAISTGEIEHTAKFTDGEKVIAEGIKFGREHVDNDGCLKSEKIPPAVTDYVHDSEHPTYWDNNWDFKIPAGADINVTFDANVSKHQFPIEFLDHSGALIEEKTYDCETKWETMSKPDVSGYEGYDCKWPETYTFSFDPSTSDKVNPVSTAHKHTLTFEGKSETQEVTYDQSFTLKYESDTNGDLKMWYDQDGNPVPTSGDKWKIDKDLTLHLEEVKEVNFDNGYLPRFMSTQEQTSQLNANNLAIVDNPNGGKMLEITVNNADDSCYLNLSIDYFTQAFATEGIKSIEFDAKATAVCSNFRSRYTAYRSDTQTIVPFNNPYENAIDNRGLGLATDHFKTFSFKKEYFTDQTQTAANLKFIWGNFGHTGEKVYIDNIRLSTEEEIDYKGFEGGGLRTVTSAGQKWKQYFYTSGGRGDNRVPHFIQNADYFMAMDEKGLSENAVTLSNDVNNGGITSLKIAKLGSSAYPLYFRGSLTPVPDYVDSIKFDIYCSETYNGNSLKDGVNNFIEGFSASTTHNANQWYTMEIKLEKIVKDETGKVISGNCTDDGRFLYVAGSSLAANFYFDNIVATLKQV